VVYPRTVRSTNILMKRVTDATLRAMDTSGFKTVVFPISEIVPEERLAGSLPPDLQQRCQTFGQTWTALRELKAI